ncbi:alkaline phosphatase family protein [Chromobacterium sp. ATCC 53434]|uniref:alkaline phosphatase family protein n=1 Tax=Chromobacterium sp. (strain ATCC 53434 / SC 14030) TaxID=2059672 RepID=UPI001F1C1111|nr:alkaline phosphatase family protein [Chromobacterium sp. ATCC 53434]
MIDLACPGAAWPDYRGGSLLNLMQTLSGELGGPDLGHAPLRGDALDGIGRHRHVCLLLIDGLGAAQLRRLGPDSRLRAGLRDEISSVFPPTTAAAVTTVLTGRAPAEHGLIGWHQLHGDEIVAPLPLYVRHPAGSANAPQALADSLFRAPPLFERFIRPAALLLPDFIADSPCSRFHAGAAERVAYHGLDDGFGQLQARLRSTTPGFHYLYLPQLDTLMHERGPDSAQARRLLAAIDAAFAALLETAAACDAAVVAIADHGFVAAPASQWLDVDADAELYGLLARPLSGETRLAYCHARPGCAGRFVELARERLDHACWAVPSAELLAAGVFGPGTAHPELARRCGDVALIAKPGWNLRDTLPGEKTLRLAGVHAGVHPDEQAIPLIACRPVPMA